MPGASSVDAYFESRLPPDVRRTVLWRTLWDAHFRFLIGSTDTVLDLGAGYCAFINAVRAGRRLAVDQWPGFTAHAALGVETHVADLADLDWLSNGSVDFAFASNVFEHIPLAGLITILARLRPKLSARGRLCLLQPNYRFCPREYFDDYTHVTVFSHVSLQEFLVANGFRILDCRPRFLPLTLKSALPVHPVLIRAYLASPFKPLAKQMLVLAAPVSAFIATKDGA